MNQQQHIINHLYELFIFLSNEGSSDLTISEGYKAVCQSSSSWPNFIFDVNFNSTSPNELAKAITTSQLPNHIILTEEQLDTYENDLLTNNFCPIAEWTCLQLENQPKELVSPDSFNIKKITKKEELKQWVKVASSGFDYLDSSIFLNCLNSKNVQFYAGFEKDQMIASALLFHHNNTAGIYHVATLPEWRKKGYGTLLFSHCEKEALKNGSDHVIAQSTSEGLNAWKKTGMKQYGIFYLFCWNKPQR